jgi:hypothetical protein
VFGYARDGSSWREGSCVSLLFDVANFRFEVSLKWLVFRAGREFNCRHELLQVHCVVQGVITPHLEVKIIETLSRLLNEFRGKGVLRNCCANSAA